MKQPIPIACVENEMALLGCAIIGPQTALLDCREAGLVEEDFTLERHQHIYRGCVDLHEQRGDGDLVQLTQWLRDKGTLEQVGGTDYLESLADIPKSAVQSMHYAREIAQKGRLRRLVESCENLAWKARNKGLTLEAAVAGLTASLADTLTHSETQETTIAEAAKGILVDLEAKRPSVYPFGFPALDISVGGVPQTGVVVVMGVPGSGKSSLTLQLGLNIARGGGGVRMFSYEMASKAIAVNALANMSAVNVSMALRTGRDVSPFEKPLLVQRVKELEGLDFSVVDSSMSAAEIYERCRVYATKGVTCVIVDYIQNLPDPDADGDTQRIERGCRTLQRIARDFGMLVFVVSQMTGAAQREDRPPKKSDGLGSSAIDQIADMTIGVYRPCVFTPRGNDETDAMWMARKRECYLHVLKNKQGPMASAQVCFRDEWTRFLEHVVSMNEGSPIQ